MVDIHDNFLVEKEWLKLRDTITGPAFPWTFSPTITYAPLDSRGRRFGAKEIKDPDNPGRFNHLVYAENVPCSDFWNSTFPPILTQLKIASLLRIKLNLSPRREKPFYSKFHVDLMDMSEEVLKQWTTSVFYINTNNGYTEFEDGTKVESVANRLVSFSADTRHRGVSQTDEQTRIVINFNYLG